MVHTSVDQLLPSLITAGFFEKNWDRIGCQYQCHFFGCWVGYSKKIVNSCV
jgi:hypothetical protein